MTVELDGARILVVADVEETRDGIERLFQKDAHRVDPARNGEGAVVTARRDSPDLILVSLGGPAPSSWLPRAASVTVPASAKRYPVVVLGLDTVDEGARVGTTEASIHHSSGQLRAAHEVCRPSPCRPTTACPVSNFLSRLPINRSTSPFSTR